MLRSTSSATFAIHGAESQMVAVPMEGSWSVRQLAERDKSRVIAFLSRSLLANVFLISKIADEGLTSITPFVEISRDGETVAIASAGTNVVMAVDLSASRETRETALAILADRILQMALPVRAIIADAEQVEMLWKRLASRIDPPSVVRLSQPVYALHARRESLLPDLREMRYATFDDLDRLVPACAAMHLEEVGIDPLARDAVAYRQRVRELVARRRSLVRLMGRKIAFKCEYSAVTPEAVQLMGVWTAPEFRRRGLAQAGLAEVCGHLLRQKKSVTLFVNDFNRPARQLYEALGFEEIGTNRALIW